MDGQRNLAGRPGELTLFTWKVLIVVLVGATVFLAWSVAVAFLLVFAGLLLAILLLRLTGAVRRWTGLHHGAGLACVLIGLALLAAGCAVLLGSTLADQFSQLSGHIRDALDGLPEGVRERISDMEIGSAWLSGLGSIASSVGWFLGNVVVILFAAIYLAASPGVYRRGAVALVPPRGHDRAREVLDVTGDALWKWMLGQFASMATVGVLTTGLLMALGMPAALALGVLALLLEFIPYIGPILAAAPAILIALSDSPSLALWVAGGYVLIQQIEGNVVLPLAQQRALDLPPVVTVGAVVAGGTLFGALGMLLATPVAVVILVLVNELYIRDRLGEPPRFPA